MPITIWAIAASVHVFFSMYNLSRYPKHVKENDYHVSKWIFTYIGVGIYWEFIQTNYL